MKLKKFLLAIGILFCTVAYAKQPIKIVIPFSPGGFTDLTARALGKALTTVQDAPVIFENKVGAGGFLAIESIVNSPVDGSTVMFSVTSVVGGTAAMINNNSIHWRRDLIPVGFGGLVPPNIIAVSSVSGIKNFQEFKQRILSRSTNFGSPGVGTPGHIYSELIKRKFQANMIHVPYKGSSPAIIDLINGNIDLYISNHAVIIEMIKAGRITPLAVIGSRKLPEAPTIPTTSSLGMPEFEVLSQNINVFWVSSKTPMTIIKQLQTQFAQAYNNEKSALQEKLLVDAVEIAPWNFVEHIMQNAQDWEDYTRVLNPKP